VKNAQHVLLCLYINSTCFWLLVGLYNCNLCRVDCTIDYYFVLGKYNDGNIEEYCGSVLRFGPRNVIYMYQRKKICGMPRLGAWDATLWYQSYDRVFME
jgi:hypothetical protein